MSVPQGPRKMKVALVHDWFTGFRGGELVFQSIAELFPDADLFTLIFTTGEFPPVILNLKRHVSFLNRVPGISRCYRHFLPLMPWAIRSFDLSGYDLVISTSHCVAKGIRKDPKAVHVSYVFAPMRYMWDRFDEYFGRGKSRWWVRLAARLLRPFFRAWDRRVSQGDRVDQLVTLSRFIQTRIQSSYRRDSQVVYPFADVERFNHPRDPKDAYLVFGAMAPYKRVDLAIRAFNRMKKPLIVAGGGQDAESLERIAGPTIRFIGRVDDADVPKLYSECKALVFPGEEDFGIVPVEAMAAGAPVIAYGAGGALETVTPDTGVFFGAQTVDALCEAVERFEVIDPDRWERACRARAREFSKTRFQKKFLDAIRSAWQNRGRSEQEWNALRAPLQR